METGALYDYVSTMPHEGWRNVLPTFISMYKNGTSDVTQESLTAYYSKSVWGSSGLFKATDKF